MVNLPVDRNGPYFDQFPPGVVYSIEFEDGASIEVHGDRLEAPRRPASISKTAHRLPL